MRFGTVSPDVRQRRVPSHLQDGAPVTTRSVAKEIQFVDPTVRVSPSEGAAFQVRPLSQNQHMRRHQ